MKWDPCKGVACPTGQVCSIQQGVGVCIEDQCLAGCRAGQTCCSGMCVEDQCRGLLCPEGSTCTLDATCTAVCQGSGEEKDKIVGAGGGGFACSYGGAESTSRTAATPLALVLGFVLLGLRRRRLRSR
jgi:hypothetical protein